ncbi:bacteriophage holin [Actinokineospora sp. PR83]|uniref:bacteriophage holin n=1 Tax=Actinokineospora sp. PR83 TaxID=2884908 RepID=UPI0027E03628|nr:bacteriophage holin [Actinokineospora sp. PR83]
MSYLPSAALVLVGLGLVTVFVVRLLRGAGRVRSAAGAARSAFGDRAGLLRARSAALRIAVAERVPSAKRDETGGQR